MGVVVDVVAVMGLALCDPATSTGELQAPSSWATAQRSAKGPVMRAKNGPSCKWYCSPPFIVLSMWLSIPVAVATEIARSPVASRQWPEPGRGALGGPSRTSPIVYPA